MSAAITPPGRDSHRASALGCALRGELTRTWTLPWTPMLLAVTFLLVAAPAVFADVRLATSAADGTGRHLGGTTGLTLAVVALMALAAVVTASGLRAGELRAAASAVPRRATLAAAQLGALTLVVLAAAAVVFVTDAVVRTRTDPSAPPLIELSQLRAGAGFCAAAVTFALLCAALTLVLRNVIVPVAVLVLTPMLLLAWIERTAPAVMALTPYAASTAAIRGQATGTSTTLSAPGGFLLLLAWSAVSVVVFTTTLARRDL